MLKKITLFAALLGFIACGNNPQQTKDMSDFGDKKEFKDAHEKPADISPDLSGKTISFDTEDGKKSNAYLVSAKADSDKYLFVIHEWWGLNDHIRKECDRYAKELDNVHVIALDMYDGNVADNPDDASRFMKAVTEDRANAIVNGALKMAGDNAKIGTIGWCFGGGWSLKSSLLADERAKACVIYYGMPVQDAKVLAPLKTDVLGIFATQDQWINPDVVKKFTGVMKATGKKLITHSFEADHAFANPSSPRYQEKSATEANEIVLKYLKKRL